jgi:hypothetical protein
MDIKILLEASDKSLIECDNYILNMSDTLFTYFTRWSILSSKNNTFKLEYDILIIKTLVNFVDNVVLFEKNKEYVKYDKIKAVEISDIVEICDELLIDINKHCYENYIISDNYQIIDVFTIFNFIKFPDFNKMLHAEYNIDMSLLNEVESLATFISYTSGQHVFITNVKYNHIKFDSSYCQNIAKSDELDNKNYFYVYKTRIISKLENIRKNDYVIKSNIADNIEYFLCQRDRYWHKNVLNQKFNHYRN